MKILRHSLVVLLSLMVFITSTGLTMNLHYCAGQLQNISMMQENADCMMKMASKKPACEEDLQKPTIKKIDSCCQNHQIKAKSDTKITDSKAKENQVSKGPFVALQSYFTSLFSFSEKDDQSDEQEADYSLFPVLKKGLYILLQQFRN